MFNKVASPYVPLLAELGMLTEDITAHDVFFTGQKTVDAVLWVHYGCKTEEDRHNALLEHYAVGDTCEVMYDVDDAIELAKGFTREQKQAVKARVATV